MVEAVQENVKLQVTEEKPKSNKIKILFIFTFVLLLVSIGVTIFLVFKHLESKETIAGLQNTLGEKEVLINTLNEENELLSIEISDLQVQIDEYIKKINAIENPEFFTNYYPVKYLFNKSQKLGQGFSLDNSRNISKLALIGSFGVGGNVNVTIYELSDTNEVNLNNEIANGSFAATNIVKEKEFEVEFEEAVFLEFSKNYIFVVEVNNALTQAGIAFAEADIVTSGKMWSFTRLIGGNGEILDKNHSWQPRNSNDVIYRLVDAPVKGIE